MKYFIIENNEQQGPFSVDELRDKHIPSDTLVWAEGMTDWTPAWKVDELKQFLYNTAQTTVPPPYRPPVEPPSELQTMPIQDTKKHHRRHRKITIAGVLLGILLLICLFTNPSKQTHKDIIKEQLVKVIDHQTSEDSGIFAAGIAMFNKLIAGGMIETAMNNLLEYHNYLVCSTTSIRWNGRSYTTSYGFMGHVFTADSDDMIELMEKQQGNFFGKSTRQGATKGSGNDSADTETTDKDNGLGDKIVTSVDKIVKDKVDEQTDSTTSEGIGKVIDDIIDFIKGND